MEKEYMSTYAISREMGLERYAVRKILKEASRKFMRELRRRGYSPEDFLEVSGFKNTNGGRK